MASNYWIKLYHEILDDAKMGRLRDNLWRRAIECFLMAGEMQGQGELPSLEDMAWRLRANEEILESELGELANVGILERRNGGWFVTNFADRQSAMSASERGKRWREQQRKQEYYADETDIERDANENQTVRSQNRKEEETDKDKIARAQPLVTAFCEYLSIPEPTLTHEAAPESWILPALKILSAVENDEDAPDLVKATMAYMDDEGLSFKNLSSLVNVARTVYRRGGASSNEADSAWRVVEEAFKRSDGSILKQHPLVLAAINAIGGWGQIKQARVNDIPFVKQRFIKEYANVRV